MYISTIDLRLNQHVTLTDVRLLNLKYDVFKMVYGLWFVKKNRQAAFFAQSQHGEFIINNVCDWSKKSQTTTCDF